MNKFLHTVEVDGWRRKVRVDSEATLLATIDEL
jgi:hypothetical protein